MAGPLASEVELVAVEVAIEVVVTAVWGEAVAVTGGGEERVGKTA